MLAWHRRLFRRLRPPAREPFPRRSGRAQSRVNEAVEVVARARETQVPAVPLEPLRIGGESGGEAGPDPLLGEPALAVDGEAGEPVEGGQRPPQASPSRLQPAPRRVD